MFSTYSTLVSSVQRGSMYFKSSLISVTPLTDSIDNFDQISYRIHVPVHTSCIKYMDA